MIPMMARSVCGLRRPLAVAVIVTAALALGGCSNLQPSGGPATLSPNPGSSPASSPSSAEAPEPSLVEPTTVAEVLRTVAPDLVLAPYRDLDGLGVFPPLSFVNAGGPEIPRVGRVLIFPSVAERLQLQPRFGEMQIMGVNSAVTWDGPTHSVWIGSRNVLTEVIMPGGTFGHVSPQTDPDVFLAAIRAALASL
jgi:hypothetical protein